MTTSPIATTLKVPPPAVLAGVALGVAGFVWLAALTSSVHPTLTVELDRSVFGLTLTVAAIWGTLAGVRILWDLFLVYVIIGVGLAGAEALTGAHEAQSVGGFVLLALSL